MPPITGTGKRTAAGRFMEDPQLYRTIEAADANILPATVEALADSINTKEQVNYAPAGDDVTGRRWAKDNQLHLQIVIPTTVTGYSVTVFGTMVGDAIAETADRWAIIAATTAYTRSQMISLENVPVGKVKVLITGVSGSIGTSIKAYYSLTD